MKEVHKKILPEYFNAIKKWDKSFEIRKDEDDIEVGDILVLEEWSGEYSGFAEKRKVSYILRNAPQFGLMEGYCIIGFERHDPDEYKNLNEITIGELIEILCKQNRGAIVLNGDSENIRIYPGRENKPGGRDIIMIC